MRHDIPFAADHHAIAALQAPDAAAGADIDVMYAPGAKLLGAADVVDVVGIATIDQDIVRLQMRQQVGDCLVDDAGGHHQPNGTRLGEGLDEFGNRPRADRLLLHKLRHGLGGHVEHHTLMATLQEAAHHIRSHPAEADHSQLHVSALLEEVHELAMTACDPATARFSLPCAWPDPWSRPAA